jgi:hypothetical protein
MGGAVRAMAPSGDTLFIGGDFTSAGGAVRCRLAAVDLVTSTANTWNPGVNTSLDKQIDPPPVICQANSNSVRTLTVSDSAGKLYGGGIFSRIQGSTPTNQDPRPPLDPPGLPRNNLAAFSFATLDSLVWPLSDMVHVGDSVGGIYVVVTNATAITAQQVGIAPKTSILGTPTFVYINPDGVQNTPVDIPPLTTRTFLIGFQTIGTALDPPTEVKFAVEGDNTTAVGSVTGVNTLFLGAVDPNQDIANIQTTTSAPSVFFQQSLANTCGQTSFVVSAGNLGDAQTIAVTPKATGAADSNTALTICLLDGGGNCVAPAASSVTLTPFAAGASASLKVFVKGPNGGDPIPNDPDKNRINVQFQKTLPNALRGIASVAVFTQGSCQ